MQVGTPLHGRAKLVHVKTCRNDQTLVKYSKISYARSLPTGELPEKRARARWLAAYDSYRHIYLVYAGRHARTRSPEARARENRS